MVPEAVARRDEPALCQMNLAPQGIAMSCTGHGRERLPGVLTSIPLILPARATRIAGPRYGYCRDWSGSCGNRYMDFKLNGKVGTHVLFAGGRLAPFFAQPFWKRQALRSCCFVWLSR